MSLVQPVMRRTVVEETPESLTIVIPAPRMWSAALFLVAWLGGWLAGEVATASALITGAVSLVSFEGLFMLAWLVGWTVGGYWAAKQASWLISGRDRIVMTGGRLSHHHESLGFDKTLEYDATRIDKMWLTRDESAPATVALAFQYGADVVTLASVSDIEGEDLLRRLGDRLGALRGRPAVVAFGEEAASRLLSGDLSQAVEDDAAAQADPGVGHGAGETPRAVTSWRRD